MPVLCPKCGEWVEFDETRNSELTNKLLCKVCCTVENEVYYLLEEAKDIQFDLDAYAEHMKGDRRGWKRNLKELKEEISKLGYCFDELII